MAVSVREDDGSRGRRRRPDPVSRGVDRDLRDHDEFGRWMQACEDEATLARQLVDLEAHNAAVLHAEQAAQLALKGLLRGVGQASQAWGHALPELAERAAEWAGLDLDDDLRSALAVLERDYKPTRYPDALVSGTPKGNYGRDDADRAIATAERVRAGVTAAWEALESHEDVDDEEGT